MKPSGFNIEDTHLRDSVRVARLLAMARIALVWAYLVGQVWPRGNLKRAFPANIRTKIRYIQSLCHVLMIELD